jgi:hypothetical protein
MKRFLGPATVLGLAAILSAQETYSTWSNHRDIYLNTQTNGASVSADVMNFPVLVRLAAKDSLTFSQALAGGADIRFTKANDATRLKHQIDTWDASTRTASIWVLVDTVKGGSRSQKIRMHWVKAGAADSSSGTAVFSNGFTNVWHLGNAADVTPTPRPNAITGGNAATPVNFPSAYSAPAGIIGKGEYLRGGNGYSAGNPTASLNNDYLNLGSITTDYSQGFSFSAWLNADILGNNTVVYSASEAPAGTATGGLIVTGGQGTDFLGCKLRQRNGTSGSNSGIINTDGLFNIQGAWSHMLATQNSNGDMFFYLNGTEIGSATGIAMYSSVTRPVNQLGTSLAHMQYLDSSFHGSIDEARLANVGRTQGWAKLEYENQRSAQTLVVFDTLPPLSIGSILPASSSRQGLSARASGRGMVFQVAGIEAGSGRLTVSDMRGRIAWVGVFTSGSDRLVWDGGRAQAGVYMASVRWVGAQGGTVKVLQAKVLLTR